MLDIHHWETYSISVIPVMIATLDRFFKTSTFDQDPLDGSGSRRKNGDCCPALRLRIRFDSGKLSYCVSSEIRRCKWIRSGLIGVSLPDGHGWISVGTSYFGSN